MTAHIPDQPTPALPPAIGPGPSPFWPQHLIDLFVRPTRFFSGQLALGHTPHVLLVTWALGMSSGAPAPDKRLPRLLLVYSSFVFAGPAVLVLAADTLLHTSPIAAYHESALSLVVLPMIFWSLFTTYKGALALFPVARARARLLFVVLPAVFYFFVVGGLALLYAAFA